MRGRLDSFNLVYFIIFLRIEFWGLPPRPRRGGRYASQLAIRSAPPLAGLGLAAHCCASLVRMACALT